MFICLKKKKKLQHLENPADFLSLHVVLLYHHPLAIFKRVQWSTLAEHQALTLIYSVITNIQSRSFKIVHLYSGKKENNRRFTRGANDKEMLSPRPSFSLTFLVLACTLSFSFPLAQRILSVVSMLSCEFSRVSQRGARVYTIMS